MTLNLPLSLTFCFLGPHNVAYGILVLQDPTRNGTQALTHTHSVKARSPNQPLDHQGIPSCKVQFGPRQKRRRDDLKKSRLPLFRQGGVTVGLTTRLSVERDQGGSIFVGRLVQAIRETLIRWDVLGIL